MRLATIAIVASAFVVGCGGASGPTTGVRAAVSPPLKRACEQTQLAATSCNAVLPRLARPLHFPAVTGCPASEGRLIQAPMFGSTIALGGGPVRIVVENAGELRSGRVHVASYSPRWRAVKTHFVSRPAYQGPFIVRARDLSGRSRVAVGATPQVAAPLFAPRGPTLNEEARWREFPYFTFVRGPGCYAWQIDGLTFREVIVARLLPERREAT